MKDLKTLSVLIIDDHQLVRDGIKAMLTTFKNNKYIFELTEADCSEAGVKLVLENDFDIVLLDYQLPDALGPLTVKKILIQKPKTKILALSSYDEYACVLNMIEAGAYGYALKNISPPELVTALETILKGKRYYSKEILEKSDDTQSNKSGNLNVSPRIKYGITKRQIEVLKLIASGMTNEAISKELDLAKRTIDVHRQHLLQRLDVHNTAALVKKATELSLL